MIFGFWDTPLAVGAIYVVGIKVWAKAQEREVTHYPMSPLENLLNRPVRRFRKPRRGR